MNKLAIVVILGLAFWVITFPSFVPLLAEIGREEQWSGDLFSQYVYFEGTEYPELYLEVIPEHILNMPMGGTQINALADFFRDDFMIWGRVALLYYPRDILYIKRGACMEYAILFSTMLTAMGYQSKIVHDYTDHMWCWVYLPDEEAWAHVDPTLRYPERWSWSFYENSWGKVFTYIYAFENGKWEDVTMYYSSRGYLYIYVNRLIRWVGEFPYW